MKKLLALLLSILVCLSLVGCNKKDNTTNETVIEPTINEVVEVPNNTTQEEVVTEEVTTTEVKEEVKDNTTLSYWVNFLNKDGSVLQRTVYKYGETPSYKGTTPTYTDYAYYYSFKGWDKQTSPVKGTQTYTALYDIVGEVPSNKTSEPTPTVTPNYLTFTANTAGSTVAINKIEGTGTLTASIQYKRKNDSDWSAYEFGFSNFDNDNSYFVSSGDVITLTSVDDYVQFKGTNSSFSKEYNTYYNFSFTGRVSASGDITSLLNSIGGDFDLSASINYENCFRNLFYDANQSDVPANYRGITTAPNLPSTHLSKSCYENMFGNCKLLTVAPALPATSLGDYCYKKMFSDCVSLSTPPALPATTLKNECYTYMFKSCSSLIVSGGQKTNCDKLWKIPSSGVFSSDSAWYHEEMFYNCPDNDIQRANMNSIDGSEGNSYSFYIENSPVSSN